MSGIKRKSVKHKNRKLLRKLYLEKKLSIREIAKKFKVDPQVIWYFLQKFDIPRRPPKGGRPKVKFEISKKILEDLYLNKKLTVYQIAKKFGIKSHKTVILKLIKYGISRRNKSETSTKYPKKPFSGNAIEKAYLLGLRTGDLHAYWHRNLIQVETQSGVKAQHEMMKKVFGKYSHIGISPPKASKVGLEQTVYVLLDKSFRFLIRKLEKIPAIILRNNKYFYAFLAGYMDAEGSWSIIKDGVNTTSFIFRLSSQDKLILEQIKNKLNRIGYTAHLYPSRRKGEMTNVGTYRKDLYSLVIYRKEDIAKLIKNLLPLSHHIDKIKRMKLILEIKNKKWSEVKDKIK